MDKFVEQENRFRIMNALHFGYRMQSGNSKPKPPTEKDIKRNEARRKLEDIRMAKDLGIDVEDLQ